MPGTRAARDRGSVRASIRCLTRSNSGTSQSRSSTMPRRVRDSEISRAVTEVHSKTRPIRTRGLRRPKQDGQVRIAQAFLDFRNEIVAQFDIDLADPRLDFLSFELLGEHLHELLVFRAVGKKDFHPLAVVPPILALRIA